MRKSKSGSELPDEAHWKILSRPELELSNIEQHQKNGVGVWDERVLIVVDPFMLPMTKEARAELTETSS